MGDGLTSHDGRQLRRWIGAALGNGPKSYRHIPSCFGGESITVVERIDRTGSPLRAWCTCGMSSRPFQIGDRRLRFEIAAATKHTVDMSRLPALIADVALRFRAAPIVESRQVHLTWFRNASEKAGLSPIRNRLPHAVLAPAWLWPGFDAPGPFPENEIHVLHAVPIGDGELTLVERSGWRALADMVLRRHVDLLDTNRIPISGPASDTGSDYDLSRLLQGPGRPEWQLEAGRGALHDVDTGDALTPSTRVALRFVKTTPSPAEPSSESLWLEVLSAPTADGVARGRVLSRPVWLRTLKRGDVIPFRAHHVAASYTPGPGEA